MNKRRIRDIIRLFSSIFFSWLYLPHIVVYFASTRIRRIVNTDIKRCVDKTELVLSYGLMFL